MNPDFRKIGVHDFWSAGATISAQKPGTLISALEAGQKSSSLGFKIFGHKVLYPKVSGQRGSTKVNEP